MYSECVRIIREFDSSKGRPEIGPELTRGLSNEEMGEIHREILKLNIDFRGPMSCKSSYENNDGIVVYRALCSNHGSPVCKVYERARENTSCGCPAAYSLSSSQGLRFSNCHNELCMPKYRSEKEWRSSQKYKNMQIASLKPAVTKELVRYIYIDR